MEANLIALKLFLDQLGIPTKIASLDDRKKVQKAVYLGQLSEIDLGYRYSWHLMGPYCVALSRDYHALEESLRAGDKEHESLQLIPEAQSKLKAIKPLLKVPPSVKLSQSGWLELIASVHFLRKISKLGWSEIGRTIKKEKNHVADHIQAAKKALTENHLL